jgi:PAS domain S-box-containing protein
VDDSQDQLFILERFLKKSHPQFDVITTESGHDALRILERVHVDAIVSDYQMPGIDGLQLLEQLRARSQMIPFIIFTGKGREEVAIHALNLGADYYLRKEGELKSLYQELIHIIQKVIAHARAERELKDSEEKYRDLVENINDSLYILDENGKIAYISPSVTSIIGYDSLDIIGRSITDFIFPEDKDKALEGIKAVLSGILKPAEYRVVSKTGETHWIRTSSKPIHSQSGFTGIRGIMTDITAQKQAEEAIREKEERFRTIFQCATDIIIMQEIFDDGRKGRRLEVNDAACQIYGYTREELLSMTPPDLRAPEEVERLKQIGLMEQIWQGEPITYETIHVAKDGTRIPVEVRSRTVTFGGKKVRLGIGRDITERKKAEETLRESETRYRRLAENASDVIYRLRLSPSLAFEYVNPAIIKMTGYTPEEYYRDSDLANRIVHPEDRHIVEKLRKSPPPAGVPIAIRWVRKDGKIIWTERQNVPIYDDDGNLVATEGIIRDITDRRKAEGIAEKQRES